MLNLMVHLLPDMQTRRFDNISNISACSYSLSMQFVYAKVSSKPKTVYFIHIIFQT